MSRLIDLFARQTYVQYFDARSGDDLAFTLLVATTRAGEELFLAHPGAIAVCLPGEQEGVLYTRESAGHIMRSERPVFTYVVAVMQQRPRHAALRDACARGTAPFVEVRVCGVDTDTRVMILHTRCLRERSVRDDGRGDDPCVRPKRPPYLRVVK